jgi:hypothetical protein
VKAPQRRGAPEVTVMTSPTTKWTRLRRRLAADGNPLRRPADKAAALLLPAAVVAFLVLSPLAVAAAAQRSWRQVPATTLAPAAGPVQPAQAADSWTTWVPARWLVAGRPQTGEIPVPAGTWAGRTVPVWLDPSGRVQIPPPSPGAVRGRVLAAAGMALASLALLLATVAVAVWGALTRRRLASWDTAWLAESQYGHPG